MAATHRNRLVTAISNIPGTTGALTIAAAASGYRTFVAADNGLSFDVSIVDGTDWEIRTGCTYHYNAGTPSLSYLDRGTLEDSSVAGPTAIALTSAAVVTVTMSAGLGSRITNLVDSGGYVYARADGTNTQSLTAAAFTRVRGNADSPSNGALMTEVSDDNGWWNAGIARFNPTRPGKYLIAFGAQVIYGSSTGLVTFIPLFYKNGAVLIWGARVDAYVSAVPIAEGGEATAIVDMNGSTDYIEPYVFANATSTTQTIREVAQGTYFMARYLGA